MTFPTFQPPKAVLVKRAKSMRQDVTVPERKLWKALRWRVPPGCHRFRRHVPIGPNITGFCCFTTRLIVELDGNQHGLKAARSYDAARTMRFESEGSLVLRFANEDVGTALDSVLDTILAHVPPQTSTPGAGKENAYHG